MEKVNLLYLKYLEEMKFHNNIETYSLEEFFFHFKQDYQSLHYIEVKKDNEISFIYYQLEKKDTSYICTIPVFGYYATSEKMMVRAFQKLASEVVSQNNVTFYVHLYAHDQECIRAYVMMEFGIQSEKCWNRLENQNVTFSDMMIKTLNKEEIKQQWKDIWDLTSRIIAHLQISPIFYPGKEFTEELYYDFYLDDHTKLIAAYKESKMIGIIEWNLEENEFLLNKKSVNVGEIYVIPSYRKTGLSLQLLNYAKYRARQEGYHYMFLEHGTANPNARGFWNQYFNTYTYQLIRTIQNKGANDDD